MQSATLERAVMISGQGLFTGEPCRAEVRPADCGLAFIKNGVRIPVHPDHYIESPNCSILGTEGERVVQTEHLLCALWAAGIDTAEIAVEGPELPSQDGSAMPLYEKLLDGGRALLNPRSALQLDGPVVVSREYQASLEIAPAPGLCIAYSFQHPELGRQDLVTVVTRLWAIDHLLPARTFITEREAVALRKAGVLKHKDETAALLIRQGRPSRPLRFADEYVRHKLLDLLGDLYAVPAEIEGNITAARSGHELNRALARQLAAML